jgi:hypothetical protein
MICDMLVSADAVSFHIPQSHVPFRQALSRSSHKPFMVYQRLLVSRDVSLGGALGEGGIQVIWVTRGDLGGTQLGPHKSVSS